MPAYVIVEVTTRDMPAMQSYREQVLPAVQAYGGRFLARGGTTVTLEGGWAPERIVIIEFPSLERAQAWWGSPEYTPLRKMRQAAGESRMIAVEGVG